MLTDPQAKLAQALGLALAAPVAISKVKPRIDDLEIRDVLLHMRGEAEEAQARCLGLATRWGEETAAEVVHEARHYEDKAGETVRAWIRPATSPLGRLEVLAMAEAAEVVTWRSLAILGGRDPDLAELVEWGLPVQERHLADALAACRALAERERGSGLREAASPRP